MSENQETIVCFCEDVTEEEIVNAIKQGFTRPVDIKYYLRPGMGPCQGRGCSSQVIRLIRQVTGQQPESIIPLSNRPPITPVPIGVLIKITKQEVMKR